MSSPETAVVPEAPGAHFLAEIRGQPQALERLLEHEAEYARVAAVARDRGATTVRMVGHGSSDNAASYGIYAFGLLPQWTAIRDSIALSVYYDTRLATAGSTVIGLSQSGRTPDVIEYVSRARKAGAFTVALTNDVTSDLAAEAEEVLPLSRKVNGPEHPDTLVVMGNLADSYDDAGRMDDALTLREEVLSLRRKVLGPEHPDTLTALLAKNGWIGALLAPLGIEVAYTPLGVTVALVFIGLPFVVRRTQASSVMEGLSWRRPLCRPTHWSLRAPASTRVPSPESPVC